MAAFEREYRVEHVVKLERNYRSFGNILDAANALITHNSRRLGKNLRTEAGPGEPVRVHEATSDYRRGAVASSRRRSSCTARARRAADRAALPQQRADPGAWKARSSTPHSVRVYGGLRFFERAEIEHALSYLRLIENPNDDTSFLRVVNFPTRGIGARTIEQLQDAARASGRSLFQSVGCGDRQGRREPGRLHGADRCDARGDARPDAARDHRARASRPRAWSTSIADREAKATSASRTWRNWSTRPRPS